MTTAARSPEPANFAQGELDTKTRLLDAAERLFAERGYEGSSMRAITKAAGANVSAANYHFGSKDELIRATLLRRIEPLNQRRLEALEALENAARGAPIEVESLVEAYLRPIFEASHSAGPGPEGFRRVAARLVSDPHPVLASLKTELFRPLAERYFVALSRSLPGVPREDLAVGFALSLGVTMHAVSGHLELFLSHAGCEPVVDEEAVFRRIVSFAAAGLRAGGHGAPIAALREGGVDS
ncbi:MAG: TetR family transcriptional regulator [Deltaproteobacteria bacterium]|nr:TetR family transcriptional regulator [Deltaproteobacteria bacterium]